jgi:predicted HTH domain antitoxin
MTTHEAKIPYDVDALAALGTTPGEIEAQMRVLLAATLYRRALLSLSKAAKMAGMEKVRFMFKLGELGVPVINLPDDEIEHELSFGR